MGRAARERSEAAARLIPGCSPAGRQSERHAQGIWGTQGELDSNTNAMRFGRAAEAQSESGRHNANGSRPESAYFFSIFKTMIK